MMPEVNPSQRLARLCGLLRNPGNLGRWDPGEIGDLLHLARALRVDGALGAGARALRPGTLPGDLERALETALRRQEVSQTCLDDELDRLRETLGPESLPCILLKGAAYRHEGHPASVGRAAGDIDILVPRDDIAPAHQRLREAGWEQADNNHNNAAYYRAWMHEFPALIHPDRQIVFDLHHALIPATDRLAFDPQPLFDQAEPVGEWGYLRLSREDQILHASAHLFRNGRFESGVRDLFDLHQLLGSALDGAGKEDFALALGDRAEELGLCGPLRLGLEFAHELFGTPIPTSLGERIGRWRGGPAQSWIFRSLVHRALPPDGRCGGSTRGRATADWILKHWPLPRREAVFSRYFWLRKQS